MARPFNARFAEQPSDVHISRSTFSLDHNVITSFNVGDLIPVTFMEVVAGDTFNVDVSQIARLTALKTPVMGDMCLDYFCFYSPFRTLWNHYKEFFGENTTGPWFPNVDYEMPHVLADKPYTHDQLGAYFAEPQGVTGLKSNAMPYRMYYDVYNNYFRDENIQSPVLIERGDSEVKASALPNGGKPLKACKFHDYFTSCLPSPQRGPAVSIGLGGLIPVRAVENKGAELGSQGAGLKFKYINGESVTVARPLQVDGAGTLYPEKVSTTPTPFSPALYPSNLYADLSLATTLSIDQFMLSYATQRYYQALARSGGRYFEQLDSLFGVDVNPLQIDIPEFLGGTSVNININQVIQQSETATTPLGTLAGVSLTGSSDCMFTKSFTEPGLIMIFAVARYRHVYQQGQQRFMRKKDLLDFYNPIFANIAEQPVYKSEIFATGTDEDNKVFGYNEAWADYRSITNKVTGMMNSKSSTPLDMWHWADVYESAPSLSSEWLIESEAPVDRTLDVTSKLNDQIMLDSMFYVKATRVMPYYSVPSLYGHM